MQAAAASRPHRLRRSAAGVRVKNHNGRQRSGGNDSVRALLKLSGIIDGINVRIGQWVAWLVLVAVLVSAANATVRKIFDTSSNAWLELQWVLFSAVFLLCAPWTLKDNEHIRIDIINNLMPQRLRNSIDIVGHAFFLLPLCVVMVVTGIPFFLRSWEVNEQSSNAGGLPQWPAKSLVMIGFALLLLQGLSELIKRIAIVRGLIPDPFVHRPNPIETEVGQVVESIERR
jgi:TRAP-type mannitol/chloroaromatic compound transport system permease small subunit